ncbi:alkaline phosphatase family protein [Halobellus limi]|uniref:Alkaline phosphatase family protein n=1 Tax=Halobellus limi TaxID=699433 RepID=A0A1H5V4D2_9EURY|nr:nucleotide pyrophosphatase/phosphodiesterase family protein [Halobellus limi]QCC46837.1 alkaline phosphatase family protein [Halobellus limi]SEF81581.1 Predicted pyrophosphatase or phosphodiesterase, AlkP superfamily [Halobellus limi]
MTASGGPTAARRVVVLDVVGLQRDHLVDGRTPNLTELLSQGTTADLRPPFPAVTVPAQTTLATGCSPAAHGDVANGEYDRDADAVAFWERDRGDRTRVWEAAADAGLTSGVLFFQHLVGTTADVAVTPSPIEDEENNLLEMDCWTNPDGFYDELEAEHGHFPLHSYWGPAADEGSSEWILTAAREAIERYDPDLLWVYVPHLDYDAQRHGPDAPETDAALEAVDELLGSFLSFLRGGERWEETVVNVVSEYGFHSVDAPAFPNRALWEVGLLSMTDDGRGGEEVDLSRSSAFAMVDHQIAHVYADSGVLADASETLETLDGVAEVLDDSGKAARDIDHPNAGDLVLVAEPDAWFQYYWWDTRETAPSYAADMDIHAKPGFDPCELFFGDDGLTSLDPTRVGGSHGRVDEETLGVYGLGGPAAPDRGTLDGPVDARAVAPTIAELLGVEERLDMDFEAASLLSGTHSASG